ncbi:glutamate-5-semialdehyde dehydrogenase [Flavobacteriaceae bacterium]|nr:glutamate-5-semialdehyde dehydrogenase [Flavobacteriaceae bacterium]
MNKINNNTAAEIASLDNNLKNQILLSVCKKLKQNTSQILAANRIDLDFAAANNLDSAKIDRLKLTEEKIIAIANSVADISNFPDPVGKILKQNKIAKNDLNIRKVSTPIGVIMVIYEARPNVTSDVAALCIKSGNASILKTGKESFHSSKAIAKIYCDVLEEFGLNKEIIHFIEDISRDNVKKLLKMDKDIDLVIPRGSKNLIQFVSKYSKIPTLKHLDGNCHCYIEKTADFQKALSVIYNAKMRRVSICGATESLVIDKKIATEFLPLLVDKLSQSNCALKGDAASCKIDSRIQKARNQDYATEYLNKVISIKIVNNINEAIKHINKYGSGHTDCIITKNQTQADKFFKMIDSAIVMHNTSTQFADGGEFGLGAEIGIATGRLHARGPVGADSLVTYKYLVDSNYSVRK